MLECAVAGPPPYDVELAGGIAFTAVAVAAMLLAMLAKGGLLWATRWASRRLLLPGVYLAGVAETAVALTLWQVRDWLFDFEWAPLVFLAYLPLAFGLNRLLLRSPRADAPPWTGWGRAGRAALLMAIFPLVMTGMFGFVYEAALDLCARLFG